MGPGPTSAAVVFSPTPYQRWATDKGLTAGVDFSYTQDADLDGRINGAEFVRDGELLMADDPIKQRVHTVELSGWT